MNGKNKFIVSLIVGLVVAFFILWIWCVWVAVDEVTNPTNIGHFIKQVKQASK